MAKNEKFSIIKQSNGQITLKFGDNLEETIDAREMMKSEQFEYIRWVILNMGRVFTVKIEKLVRKEIGFYG